jgi:hypothetical protein
MKRLCWGLLVLFATAIPVTVTPAGADPARKIAEPGRGADPNSVPDLAGAGTSAASGVVNGRTVTWPNLGYYPVTPRSSSRSPA